MSPDELVTLAIEAAEEGPVGRKSGESPGQQRRWASGALPLALYP
jgi:hypothetical protein